MPVPTPEATRDPAPDWAVVLNAAAGAILGDGDAHATVQTGFEAVGLHAAFIPHEPGTLPERIDAARATGARCVVVAGGDGTIACAAQALAGTGTALGIIPCGTMNLMAGDLRIAAGDMKAAIATLATSQPRAIDVGEVGEQVFLCASMLGTPARLSRHREAGRRRGGGLLAWASLGRAAWRALRQNTNMRLTLRCNGETLRVRSPSVTITVNPLHDETGRMFGRSRLDGGTLAVYIVRPSTPWRQAKLLFRMIAAGGLQHPDITLIHTTELEIDANETALHVLVDGEARLLAPPLRYTIRPAALRVMAPEPAA